MSRASIPIGIYVIVSGVLLGIAMALVMSVILNEQGSEGGTVGVVALLSFVGVSGTTIGIGILVILMGRVPGGGEQAVEGLSMDGGSYCPVPGEAGTWRSGRCRALPGSMPAWQQWFHSLHGRTGTGFPEGFLATKTREGADPRGETFEGAFSVDRLKRFLWPGGRLRWVAIGGYAAAVVVAVIAIVLLLLLRELGRPGEATAQYIPSSALVYSSINLRPGLGQIDRAVEVGDLLRTDDLLDEEDDLLGRG